MSWVFLLLWIRLWLYLRLARLKLLLSGSSLDRLLVWQTVWGLVAALNTFDQGWSVALEKAMGKLILVYFSKPVQVQLSYERLRLARVK